MAPETATETVTETQLDAIVGRSIERTFGPQFKEIRDALAALAKPAASPVPEGGLRAVTGGSVEVLDPDLAIPKSERHCLNFARWMSCKAAGRLAQHEGGNGRPVDFAIKRYGENHAVTKALGSDTLTGGGALVPTEFYQEVIEFLRPRQVVRSMNPTILPMDTGKLTIPKITNGAVGGYVGENATKNAEQQTLGSLSLSAKKLALIVPLSMDLVRRSSPQADMVVRDDLVRGIGVTADTAWIRGAGSAFSPKGLRYLALAGNVFATAGATVANINTDLTTALTKLETANVDMSRAGWLFSPRSKLTLMTLLNSNGFPVYRDEMAKGTLLGYPFASTSVIPTNLSGTQTEVYMVAWQDFVIGESTQLLLDSSTEAAYADSGGTVIPAFSQDQMVLRAIMEHDCGLRHDESVAIVTGVAW